MKGLGKGGMFGLLPIMLGLFSSGRKSEAPKVKTVHGYNPAPRVHHRSGVRKGKPKPGVRHFGTWSPLLPIRGVREDRFGRLCLSEKKWKRVKQS